MKKITAFVSVAMVMGLVFMETNMTGAEETGTAAEVPEFYTVEKGDTLWDISERFFRNPFSWPAVWQKNDYIANPDLIYPGNKLKLFFLKEPEPVDEPVARTVEAPTEPPVKKVSKKAPPKEYRLTAMSKSKDFFDSAGFIDSEDPAIGKVHYSYNEKTNFATLDKVILKFQGYTPQIGERVVAYSILERVKHPLTRVEIGNLIKILGHLKILEKNEGVYTAEIIKVFDVITLGDKIRKYEEVPIPLIDPTAKSPSKNINGYIVATEDKKQYVGPNSLIYIDRGRMHGVTPGDVFEIAYDVPPLQKTEWGLQKIEDATEEIKENIGEFRVLTVRSNTATGWMTKSVREVGVGDKFHRKGSSN